jgi:predicted nuclease of predicted toxin-antitoxin system
VKLWFDEDLSPTLVRVAHEHGLDATCNRDRGVLGHTDAQLRHLVQGQGYVLVTDNASDFRAMYARDDVHPGLVVIPASDGRGRQQQLAHAAIA